MVVPFGAAPHLGQVAETLIAHPEMRARQALAHLRQQLGHEFGFVGMAVGTGRHADNQAGSRFQDDQGLTAQGSAGALLQGLEAFGRVAGWPAAEWR